MTYYRITYYKQGKLNLSKTLLSYTKFYLKTLVDKSEQNI